MKTIGAILLSFVLFSSPVVSGEISKQPDCRKVQRTIPFTRKAYLKPVFGQERKKIKIIPVCRGENHTIYRDGQTTVSFGKVSYYDYDGGKKLASGERYSRKTLTAAHRTLPFGTLVRVVRLDTNESVIVKINDRGPFIRHRIIDLNLAAAKQIGLHGRKGIAPCRVEVLSYGRT